MNVQLESAQLSSYNKCTNTSTLFAIAGVTRKRYIETLSGKSNLIEIEID